MTTSLLLASQACLITNRDIDTLKEQVRLEQQALVDLQGRVEEQSMQLEGIENSLQMLESRMDDNAQKIDDMEARLVAEVEPAREFILPTPVEEETQRTSLPADIFPAAREEYTEEAGEELTFGEEYSYTKRAYTTAEELYQSAYNHFEEGDLGQAILEFEEYVANYGSTDLADNAQYWIGECYYAQKDYRQAIREFEKVEVNFPGGNKVPAAKIKKGMAYREMGNLDQARKELQEVIDDYPTAEEALLAREKLRLWR